ncbi:contactin-4-like, partial [Mytilus edulis]
LPTVSVIAELPAVKYGDKVHIFCVVSSNPSSTKVYWEKKTNNITKKINKGTSGTDGITVTNPSLIILHATDSDSGLYRCFAVNVVGIGYSSSVNLDVIGGVPEVSVPSITHLTGTGYTVTLVCKVKNAIPEVFRVYWQRYLHGSITVISSASIGIKGVTVESPSLIIPSAMESMTGEYTCFAVNSVGTGSSLPATLTVKAGGPSNIPVIISEDSDSDHSLRLELIWTLLPRTVLDSSNLELILRVQPRTDSDSST